MMELEERQRVVELVEKFVKQNEYDRFFFLIDSLDELNKMWFLHFINVFISGDENEWVIWDTEPQEYLNLFNEIFEILDGYYWYYDIPDDIPIGTRARWIIHKINEED